MSYLASANSREEALNTYEQKLTATVSTVQQLRDVLVREQDQANQASTIAVSETRQTLQTLNQKLSEQASVADITDAYQHYQKSLAARTSITIHQSMLDDIIKLADPLFVRADKRLKNIQLNRQALIDNIQVVEADDPGLVLIRKQ